MNKTTKLRAMLSRPGLDFILEAHDGLSARIVEQAGFDGIWASGLAISAQLGVRDNNEASWTQVLEVVEFMSDASSIPILLDGDTGYGNFNNARRLIRKLEQRQVAGVCLEDKQFPKTNSFIGGERQPLADADEFAGKIKAAKDGQTDDDFCVVARVEALIAGWGMDEALRRAELYHAAGADAILIHSKISNASQVVEFKRRWGDRAPVVIVPTKYYATPTEVFEEAGFSLAIWANHLVRSAISAMERTAARIHRDRSLFNVEGRIASVGHIFELQGADELAEAEKRYLPETRLGYKAILLAAGHGAELGALTEDRPKCMIEVGGRPILAKQVDVLKSAGLRDITVVRGYKKEAVDIKDVVTVDVDEYEETRSAWSLHRALGDAKGPALVTYGDILYRNYVLTALLEETGDIVAVVDRNSTDRKAKPAGDYVLLPETNHSALLTGEALALQGVAEEAGPCDGELIGLLKTSGDGTLALRAALDKLAERDLLRGANLSDIARQLLDMGQTIHVVPITGNWVDVNTVADLADASKYR
ncbi:MAG: phosphoenolpyruvate mutase [Planctomycetota bacterium]|jgi:phosphoenolpyruvate phosphomutase